MFSSNYNSQNILGVARYLHLLPSLVKSILSDTLADRLYLLWCNTSETLSMSVLSVSAGKDGVLQLKQKNGKTGFRTAYF